MNSTPFDKDTILPQYISSMGPDLGEFMYHFNLQVFKLKFDFLRYQILYKSSMNRKLLNNVAPLFFGHIQGMMFDGFILHMARLTDNQWIGKGPSKKKTFSIKWLPDLIIDMEFKKEVETDINNIIIQLNKCRTKRNNELAHLNYERVISPVVSPITKNSDLEAYIKQFAALLNKILKFYKESPFIFELLDTKGKEVTLHRLANGDVEALLFKLDYFYKILKDVKLLGTKIDFLKLDDDKLGNNMYLSQIYLDKE